MLLTKKKRKKPVQLTARSLKYLRDQGYLVQVVERWNSFAKVRIDLFGFIDVVAIKDNAIVGVQVTSANNHAARRTKIFELDSAKTWLQAGGEIIIHSWRKKQVGKRQLWQVREEQITIDEILKYQPNGELELV